MARKWKGPRPTAIGLQEAVMFDIFPDSPAMIADFFIMDQEHYEALYYPIRAGEITLEDLDRVLGDARAITKLVNAAPSNPHKGIVFGFGGPEGLGMSYGLGAGRGRKIQKVWKFTNHGGDCYIFASIARRGKKPLYRTLGECGDPEVENFMRLWQEGFVTHEADIEERLMQPIEGLPGPEGEALTARPIDIERELDMARNMFGKLRPDIKTRLRAVLYQPTEETWEDAHTIIVGSDGWMTLWQAVIAVDPTFPKTGQATDSRGRVVERWKKIPSQETLIKALRYATH